MNHPREKTVDPSLKWYLPLCKALQNGYYGKSEQITPMNCSFIPQTLSIRYSMADTPSETSLTNLDFHSTKDALLRQIAYKLPP